MRTQHSDTTRRDATISINGIPLQGDLFVPEEALGVVVFAHGSGSSRQSPRNQFVADVLRKHGAGTLLFDLLTKEEETADHSTGNLRFDIEFLAHRLIAVTEWLENELGNVSLGYFGASTGGAAALMAAAHFGSRVTAVVSRGGRPDLAGDSLEKVTAPTLLIVGGNDAPVISLNRMALDRLTCTKELQLIHGATHLFDEPGTLEQVARLSGEWFEQHFRNGSAA